MSRQKNQLPFLYSLEQLIFGQSSLENPQDENPTANAENNNTIYIYSTHSTTNNIPSKGVIS